MADLNCHHYTKKIVKIEVLRKRGRPKIKNINPPAPAEKLLDKIRAAVANSHGIPTVYASTTKGGMKLIYEGHHFRYSFRKGQFSIFQCCYKENREECKVRVVSDQKRVYPLDGEHVHFMQATDKSVTAVLFEPMDSVDEHVVKKNLSSRNDIIIQSDEKSVSVRENIRILNVGISKKDRQPTPKEEPTYDNDDDDEASGSGVNPNDFRDKIKKRLQKALMGKKK